MTRNGPGGSGDTCKEKAIKKVKRAAKEAAALGQPKLAFKSVDAGTADGAPEVVTQ